MSTKWSNKFELKPGRWVFVPTDEFAQLGARIKRTVDARWKRPAYYYHLQPGGHLSALRAHLPSQHFLHLDIENFFGSINKSRLTRCLKPIIGYELARQFSIDSTVRSPADKTKFCLPYGFVQSQLLASICLRGSALGMFLHRLCLSRKAVVSVYVDDIIISTDTSDLAVVASEAKQAAKRSLFTLNVEKKQGPASEIQAFNIRLASDRLAVTESRLAEFIAALANPNASEESRRSIIGYIRSVNEAQASAI